MLEQRDIDYPRDVLGELIMKGSPYAFYLFQWVDYKADAKHYRLKLLHDIKLFNGEVHEGLYPNADSFSARFKDKDVEFIRISKKQLGYEYKDPRA